MRITYIGHTRFPTEKAHGRQIAEVCGALMSLGHEVTLVHPTVKNPITESALEYYDLPVSFEVVRLLSFDALSCPLIPMPFAFIIGMHSYRKHVATYLKQHVPDLLYTRAPILLHMLLKMGIPVVLELHTLPRTARRSFIDQCNQCRKIVCLTSPMREELVSWGVDVMRIIVEGDAVREEFLRDPVPLEEMRKRFMQVPIIGYIGSLVARNTMSKGVEVLIDALALLKREGVRVKSMIVGGPENWKKKLEEHARTSGLHVEDIVFIGWVPSKGVPALIEACDVCVYPAPASSHPYFTRDTSPLKLFEYMAAGKPVAAAADLPPIRDILDENSAIFFKAGDAVSLAAAIRDTLAQPHLAHQRAGEARRKVVEHTWTKRMARILAKSS